MFIKFKLSKDFKRREMDVMPKAPKDANFATENFEGALIKVHFPNVSTLVCEVENGTCLGRLMLAVNKEAASWYSDYNTRKENHA